GEGLDADKRIDARSTGGLRPGDQGNSDGRDRSRIARGINAAFTIQRVVARVAGDRVVERVAGAIDVAAAGQGQILDLLAAQAEGDRTADQIDASVGSLDHGVADIVD